MSDPTQQDEIVINEIFAKLLLALMEPEREYVVQLENVDGVTDTTYVLIRTEDDHGEKINLYTKEQCGNC